MPPSSGRFYTDEAMQARMALMSHPDVLAQLEQLWTSANANAADAVIDKDEYMVMHRKMLLSIKPQTTPREAVKQAETDWQRDSEGNPGLDRKRFYWTWFELADLYSGCSHLPICPSAQPLGTCYKGTPMRPMATRQTGC